MPVRLKFRPSSAKRWFNCPGQPLVAHAASIVPRPSEPDAHNGTKAHCILASGLSGRPSSDFWKPEDHGPLPTEPVDQWLAPDEMEIVHNAVEHLALFPVLYGGEMFIEFPWALRFEGMDYVMSGTIDFILVTDTTIYIVDYKHGVGEFVDARHLLQLILYAAGARARFPGRSIMGGILQPRRESKDGDTFRMYPIPDAEIDHTLSLANAAIIRGHVPDPEFNPGRHCDKCEGLRGFCPAMAKRLLYLAAEQADEEWGISGSRPWWVLDAEKWIPQTLTKIRAEAVNTLSAGGEIPGWTLGERNGRRGWADESTAPAALSMKLGIPLEKVTRATVTTAPITIGDAEKLAKKAGVDISDLINTPKVRVLVPSDRTGYKPTAFTAVTE